MDGPLAFLFMDGHLAFFSMQGRGMKQLSLMVGAGKHYVISF